DRLLYRRFGLGVGQLLRQEGLDDRNLLLLLLCELRTVALLIKLDRLAALLDQSLHHAMDVAVLDPIGIAFAARVNVSLLERRQNHAHGREAALVACLHRVLERGGQSVTQSHELPPPGMVFHTSRGRAGRYSNGLGIAIPGTSLKLL